MKKTLSTCFKYFLWNNCYLSQQMCFSPRSSLLKGNMWSRFGHVAARGAQREETYGSCTYTCLKAAGRLTQRQRSALISLTRSLHRRLRLTVRLTPTTVWNVTRTSKFPSSKCDWASLKSDDPRRPRFVTRGPACWSSSWSIVGYNVLGSCLNFP